LRQKYRQGLGGLWLPQVGWGSDDIKDISGNGNHAIGSSNPAHSLTEMGRVATLDDSSDHYDIAADDSMYPGNEPYTYAVLTYCTSTGADGRLFYKYDGEGFALSTVSSKWRWYQWGGSGNIDSDVSAQSKWTVVVVRRDTNNLVEMWVDGVVQSDTETGANHDSAGNDFQIGMDYLGDNHYYGHIAWMGWWPTVAWGVSEVQALTFDPWNTLFRNPEHIEVRVAAAGTTDISLTWTDNAESETGFELQRTNDGGTTWDDVTSGIAADAESYTDSGVATGQTYQYRLRALNATKGNSEWAYSNEVAV
jgi:hypothetical protein